MKTLKQIKRLAAMVLVLCSLVAMLSTVVQATTYARGTCGKRLTWTLDSNGTLTISGTGAMDTWYWNDTPWYKNKDAITKVVIKHGVTTIGSTAFNYCKNLTSVTIPGSVTAIDWCAFSYCTSLASITIPNSVTSIGDSAFKYCYSLHSFAIPDSVINLGENIFSDCISLEHVTFGNGVTSISDGMFNNCESLFNITIPRNIRSIGEGAFSSSGLKSITIPGSITTIDVRAFNSCANLERVTIENGVSSICDFAFRSCINLKYITIPDSVTSIGNGAFTVCSNLTSAVIGDSVTNIGDSAFEYCYKLQSVSIPKTVKSIGDSAFASCGKLNWIYYEGTTLNAADIRIHLNNNQLDIAQWHYESTDIGGVEPAYHCGECNKNYWWDGTQSYFTDVVTNNWQHAFAKYAVDQNLMTGTGTDAYGRVNFLPNKPISREEFVQVLYNAEGRPSASIQNKFPDVVDSGWYKNAVLWANESGVVMGMGNGKFGVGMKITRQDLAVMLYRYAQKNGYSLDSDDGKINIFCDGNIVSDYAKTAMDWAVTNGILNGKGAAGQPIYTYRLDPIGTATRAECAAMLKNFRIAYRICNHINLQATEAKPATCTENGNIAYWICDDCGRYFIDAETTAEILPENTDLVATGHSWLDATCTSPKTCNNCGETLGFEAGHKWKAATCTEPEHCTVCNETRADALGHYMRFTKCVRTDCDHIDFSCIAGTYTNIGGYGVLVGTTTMVDLDAENVSVSDSGELSFTCNGKTFTLTLQQNDESDQFMAYFDCYLNGKLVENVDFRAGSELYDNRIYLDQFIVDNIKIYLVATR